MTGDIYLSCTDRRRAGLLLKALQQRLPIIIDSKNIGPSGPAAAICTSLMKIESDYLLFLPGDIPWVEPSALTKFAKMAIESNCEIGTLYWTNGMTENLIQFHRRGDTLKKILGIARLRKQLMRASDMLRGVDSTYYLDVSAVTSNALCFSNVNTKMDLENPKPRGKIQEVSGSIKVSDPAKEHFGKGIELLARNQYLEAARNFENEARCYEDYGLRYIAFHCLLDSIRCYEAVGIKGKEMRQRLRHLTALGLSEDAGRKPDS